MASAGRKAVVTGAASGIGRAATERLRREGVECSRSRRRRGAPERAALLGCDVFVADLADRGAARRLADTAADSTTSSTPPASCASSRSSKSRWRTGGGSQTVNAESVFFLCQLIGARLNPGGAVVNLSSSSAKLATSVDVAAYAASKTTILSITRSFAYALAERRSPGQRDLPRHRRDGDAGAFSRRRRRKGRDDRRRVGRRAKKGRAARARRERRRNAPGLISFLLSDAAAYMTGQADQFHRRLGQLVKRKGGELEEADHRSRHRAWPS